ncbi:MAG: SMP-30/gluconolactonase/LRE family protein [Nitrospiraceae bacterium]
MKVDVKGNVYCTGPGGIWIISPEGRHLGTITLPEIPHNLAWGDDDGKTLYIIGLSGIYKIRTRVTEVRPDPQAGS